MAAALGCGVTCFALPSLAQSHILVGREDLPIPAWMFAWGASIVLIVSFFVLSVAWTTRGVSKIQIGGQSLLGCRER